MALFNQNLIFRSSPWLQSCLCTSNQNNAWRRTGSTFGSTFKHLCTVWSVDYVRSKNCQKIWTYKVTQGQFWLGALQNSGATSFGQIKQGDLDLSTLSYTSSLNTRKACCLVTYYSAVQLWPISFMRPYKKKDMECCML